MVIFTLNQWFIKGRELNHLIVCVSICVCEHAQVQLHKCENLQAPSCVNISRCLFDCRIKSCLLMAFFYSM